MIWTIFEDKRNVSRKYAEKIKIEKRKIRPFALQDDCRCNCQCNVLLAP